MKEKHGKVFDMFGPSPEIPDPGDFPIFCYRKAAAPVLEDELNNLKVSELKARAKAAGIDEKTISDTDDDTNTKESLIKLISAAKAKQDEHVPSPPMVTPVHRPESTGTGIWRIPLR